MCVCVCESSLKPWIHTQPASHPHTFDDRVGQRKWTTNDVVCLAWGDMRSVFWSVQQQPPVVAIVSWRGWTDFIYMMTWSQFSFLSSLPLTLLPVLLSYYSLPSHRADRPHSKLTVHFPLEATKGGGEGNQRKGRGPALFRRRLGLETERDGAFVSQVKELSSEFPLEAVALRPTTTLKSKRSGEERKRE